MSPDIERAADDCSAGSQSASSDGSLRRQTPPSGGAARRSRRKGPAHRGVRMRIRWAVVTDTMRQVAIYDYAQRAEADRRAEELNQKSNVKHFVLAVRQPIPEGDI
jgi:hypothetical protein